MSHPWPHLSVPSVEQYKAFCEEQGWIYIARFTHPIEDVERYHAIKAPKKHFLRCALWGTRRGGTVEDICAVRKPVIPDDQRPGFLGVGKRFIGLESHQRFDGDCLGPNHFYRREYPHLVSDMKETMPTEHPEKAEKPKKTRKRKAKEAA